MQVKKMIEILDQWTIHGNSIFSNIGVSGGGELTLEPTGQPTQSFHKYLLSKGFICVDGIYIYRP